MPRSSGYRPKAAVREEILELRERLSNLRSSEWAKAGRIMDQITSLLGHRHGPMRGKIAPRACKYCGYFGHTRQWCAARLAAEATQLERMRKEDAALFAKFEHVQEKPPYDARTSPQALTFDSMRMPYTIDPMLGPLVGVRGEVHGGKWTFDANGEVTENHHVAEQQPPAELGAHHVGS